jgi:hypothetical protein
MRLKFLSHAVPYSMINLEAGLKPI